MATYWIVLLLLIVDKLAIFETCRSGIECPSHKPFCSSLGCLQKCTEPFYKNNTDCVSNCGDWFVESGQTCVKECRATEFIEETLKVSIMPFIERKCVSECPKFILNKTCTDICPVDYEFVYDESYTTSGNGDIYSIVRNKRCVEKCPDSYLFKQTISSPGESITICTAECSLYSENGYCVDVCSGKSVIFNNTCVSTCPESHPVLNKYRVCSKLCRHGNVEESSCACPWNKPFVQNKTCVEECGPTLFQWNHNETNMCIESCFKDEFIYNVTCVKDCPSKTYKFRDKCLYECPESMPYYCAINSSGFCDDRSLIFTCFEKCPVGMYVDEFNCKYSCPKYTLNATCINTCPEILPLSFYNETGINCRYGSLCMGIIRQNNCLTECPDGFLKHQNSCVKACEKNEYIFNGTCLTECPYQMKSRNFIMKYTETKDIGPNAYFYRYVTDTKTQLTNECVNNCVSNEYQYNNTCVAACPDDKLYVTNQVCDVGPCTKGFYYNMTTLYRCVDVCNDSDFILNSECLNVCPNNTYALNNRCVNVCPNNTLLTRKVKTECKTYCPNFLVHVYISCLEQCPNNTYNLNNSCVEFCPEQYVIAGRVCLQSCPETSPYTNKTTLRALTWTYSNNRWTYEEYNVLEKRCLANCPVGYFKRRDTCTIACEKNEYILNETCLTECPSQMKYRNYTQKFTETKDRGPFYYYPRFITETKLNFVFKCVNSCESNEYQYNNTCVAACPDDKLYATNQVCDVGPCTKSFYYNMTTFYRCVDVCNESDFNLNSECLNVCPNNTYALNNRCVNVCPNNTLLTRKVETECTTNCPKFLIHEYTRCLEQCPNNTYKLNNSCVEFCPKQYVTAHRDCLHSCPETSPYINETILRAFTWTNSNNSWTYEGYDFLEKRCLAYCPDGYFKRNNSCKIVCERNEYILNETCLTECPKHMKYRNYAIHFTETKDRSPFYYYPRHVNETKIQLFYKCVNSCESNEYQYNNKCDTTCPDDLPYSSKGVCSPGPCSTNYYYNMTTFLVCVDTCEESDFILDSECVYVCPNNTYAFNNQCVNMCPNDTYLTLNIKTECGSRSICSDSKFPIYESCLGNCPKEKYTLNKSCVDFCPEQYVTAERNCVRSCPNNLPYTNETVLQIYQWRQNNKRWEYSKQIKFIKNCVSDCINQGRLLDLKESDCVDSCPTSRRYLENNVCKSECSATLVTNENECVEKCPNEKLVSNNTCVDMCPSETKYQNDGSCLQSCPSESPFGVTKSIFMFDNFLELKIIYVCINSCEDRQLLLNGECVNYFKCIYPMFGFKGQCLLQCPLGSVYTFSGGCLCIINVIIAILVIIGTLVVICIYTRKIIRDCAWVWFYMFTGQSSLIQGRLKKVSRNANQFQLEMDNLTFSTSETELEEKETLL